MILVVLPDLLQGLVNELVSREALVGVSVSKQCLHTSANGKAVSRAEGVLAIGPRVREHVSSKAGLDRPAPLVI